VLRVATRVLIRCMPDGSFSANSFQLDEEELWILTSCLYARLAFTCLITGNLGTRTHFSG
jgi:hypothetical protein